MDQNRKLAAVLLAAGPSTRLGQAKQLVQHRGETLVRRMARMLAHLPLEQILVVTGCEDKKVTAELTDLPVEVVYNGNWATGMGSSIACGARAVDKSANGVLLMVCDQWCLEEDDLLRLINTWNADISQIYLARWIERKASVSGPPVLFPGKLIPELKFLIENRGARQVIDRHMDIVQFVDVQNAASDLDRPEDLEEMARGDA